MEKTFWVQKYNTYLSCKDAKWKYRMIICKRINLRSIREAAKKVRFLMAGPLRGGGAGL